MFFIYFKKNIYVYKTGGIQQNCKYLLFNILILSMSMYNTDEGVIEREKERVSFVHDAQTNQVVSITLIFLPFFFFYPS